MKSVERKMTTVRAFGYRMRPFDAVRLWIKRLACRHTQMEFHAATCGQWEGRSNLSVGLVARCPDCRRAWPGDVVVGIGSTLLRPTEQENGRRRNETSCG